MKSFAYPFVTRMAWVIGCTNMALHQKALLSFKNPMQEEWMLSEEALLSKTIDDKLRKDLQLP